MERVIEYYVTRDAVNTFVVSPGKDKLELATTSCAYDELAFRVDELRGRLWTGAETELLAGLHDLLLAPLYEQSMIEPGDTLCISPHRCLHSIPFGALGPEGEPVIGHSAVAYVPSAAVIPLLASPREIPGEAAVIIHNSRGDGEWLRDSFAREAAIVAEILSARLITDDDADQIDYVLRSARTVHFTCHARFDSGRGGRSGILVGDGRGGERLLTADEIVSSRCVADLITFGGCDTARSPEHAADERVGLVRAALMSGAKSVLASLWPLDSVAAEHVFAAFYRYQTLGGTSKAESLRAAQLGYYAGNGRVGRGEPAPSLGHWGPFVLAGDWR